MGWPFSYDASGSQIATVINAIKAKLREHATDPAVIKAVVPGRVGHTLAEISAKVSSGREAGEKLIGYYSDVAALQNALRALDGMPRGADPRRMGEAFGEVFQAAAKMMSYLPEPFSAYARPLEEFGKAFGRIAEMMSGNTKYYNSGYSQSQLRGIMNVQTTGNL